MKLDITLCYSILEYCFDNIELFVLGSGHNVLKSINQHRKVINDELEGEWEKYFKINRPDLLDSFQSYMSMIITDTTQSKIISSTLLKHKEKIKIENKYHNILFTTCCNTEDRILLSNNCETTNIALQVMNIELVSTDKILSKEIDSKFSKYTLPILNKKIESGMDCYELSSWLGRFLKEENEITIIDNYIYQNESNFFRYFISHVPLGSAIKIYTFTDGISYEDIKRVFSHPRYKNWYIEVFIISSKKDQHARNIITNNYFIHLEKGMGVFGNGRLTDQSDISIYFKSDVPPYSLPNCTQIM